MHEPTSPISLISRFSPTSTTSSALAASALAWRRRIPLDFQGRPEPLEPPAGALDRWVRRLWSGRAFRSRAELQLRRRAETIVRLLDDARGMPTPLEIAAVRAALRASPDAESALLPAFVLVARVAGHVLRMRPYPVQILGALLIHDGRVAEMATGEGKTLTVMLAASVRALSGTSVHVVTVNDYLAQRDHELAKPMLHALGLTGGLVVGGLEEADRRQACQADVVHCSNKELAFDFLRGRLRHGRRSLQGLPRHAARLSGHGDGTADTVRYQFAIVDEADSVLLDEALTPLVIAETVDGAEGAEGPIHAALALARELVEDEDFVLDRHAGAVALTDSGERRVIARLDLRAAGLDIARHKIDLVTKALRALHLLVRDRAYIVQEGKAVIVDEGTGRVLADRSWEGGLHQLVEAKEGLELTPPRRNVERISFQQFFATYHTLSGTSGTVREVAGELLEHYRLRTVAVPLHRPSRRTTLPARVFRSRGAQYRFIRDRIVECVRAGRPVLVGTRDVRESERLAVRLREAGVPFSLLNARFTADEASLVALAGQPGRVTVATNMAGRGTDIALGDGVAQGGGLHVILTELHDAGRIDRQLAGRCARQGDPGSFEMLLRIDPRGTLAPSFDRMLLRWCRRRWPAAGAGLLPRLLLAVRRIAQRLREREHASVRRRLVAAEVQAASNADF